MHGTGAKVLWGTSVRRRLRQEWEDERRATTSGSRGALWSLAAIVATDESVDASGVLVMPGFVDAHVHFMDPGDPTRDWVARLVQGGR